MKVGFIGLGEQGAPMAERVLGAGHELLVYARRPEVRAHFAQLGAEVVGAPAGLGRCELVEVCVMDDQQVEDVLVGNGILEAMAPGGVAAVHRGQDLVGTRLDRQVQERHQRWHLGMRGDQQAGNPAASR